MLNYFRGQNIKHLLGSRAQKAGLIFLCQTTLPLACWLNKTCFKNKELNDARSFDGNELQSPEDTLKIKLLQASS